MRRKGTIAREAVKDERVGSRVGVVIHIRKSWRVEGEGEDE